MNAVAIEWVAVRCRYCAKMIGEVSPPSKARFKCRDCRLYTICEIPA